jgi:Carboxypeptidase regulatory-like domain
MTTRTPRALSARITLLISVLVALTTIASAQAGRGAISGLISDTSGAIVPGAKVTATNQATGIRLGTLSSAAGLYSFVSLSPGSYEVMVTAQGFETTVHKNIPVTVDQVSTINVSLNVGSVSEVVSVNASTSLVETSNSTVGS